MTADLDRVTDHLRTTLGVDSFDEHVAHGATMTIGQAVSYARLEIRAALERIGRPHNTETPLRKLRQEDRI